MKIISVIVAILFIFGCKSDHIEKPEPAIVFNTPVANQHFVKGDTIHITGIVTHLIAIKEVAVHMTDLTSKVEFFHNHFSAGNTNMYNFSCEYIIPDNSKTSFDLEVEATDVDGITGAKEMLILIN